jgi:TATA-box binding protein (TBP) (component of TFIID and TFIIIB)
VNPSGRQRILPPKIRAAAKASADYHSRLYVSSNLKKEQPVDRGHVLHVHGVLESEFRKATRLLFDSEECKLPFPTDGFLIKRFLDAEEVHWGIAMPKRMDDLTKAVDAFCIPIPASPTAVAVALAHEAGCGTIKQCAAVLEVATERAESARNWLAEHSERVDASINLWKERNNVLFKRFGIDVLNDGLGCDVDVPNATCKRNSATCIAYYIPETLEWDLVFNASSHDGLTVRPRRQPNVMAFDFEDGGCELNFKISRSGSIMVTGAHEPEQAKRAIIALFDKLGQTEGICTRFEVTCRNDSIDYHQPLNVSMVLKAALEDGTATVDRVRDWHITNLMVPLAGEPLEAFVAVFASGKVRITNCRSEAHLGQVIDLLDRLVAKAGNTWIDT